MSSLTSSLTSSITEQLSASSRSQLETQLNFFNTVLRKSVENVQQVTTLNINTAKNVLERSTTSARELLEAKDPREVLTLAARPLPTVEGLLSYGRELYGIASRAQVDLLQSASDQFRATASKTLALTTANVGKVTEDVVAASQTALQTASRTGLQTILQSGSQATTQAVDATRQVVAQTAEAANAAVHQAGDATQQAAQQLSQHIADASEQVVQQTAKAGEQAVQAAAPVVEAARHNTEQVAATASDNVEQATAAIAAAVAVADAAPVTPAAETAEAPEATPAPKTMRGRPAAKPVAEALSAIADKGAASLKSVPNSGKSQPRK